MVIGAACLQMGTHVQAGASNLTVIRGLSGDAMRYSMVLIVMSVIMGFMTQDAWAKRSAPSEVKPVVYQGVEYQAPTTRMGCVVALDVASGKELWSKQIYTVIKDPDLEGDVQDIFITSLTRDGETLLITNESGAQYSLDLQTQEVKTIK